MKMIRFMFIAIFAISFHCQADELPSFIHVCHKEDPNLVQCLMASVEDIRPFLIEGVPEYKVPSLEPLIMTDFFSEETAGMMITVYNVSAWGCSDFFVRGIEVNMETHDFLLFIDIPKLRIEAHYSVDGKLLLMPIKGNGNLETNITDISAKAHLTGNIFQKNEEDYLKFDKFDLKVIVGGGQARLESLFNNDKVLLNMINDVVNKNFDMFLKELMPIIEKSLASVFMDTANAIVQSFTYKQLFPH